MRTSGMGCDHTGPEEVIAMVEAKLQSEGVPPRAWSDRRFGWGENVEGMWRSVYIEVERREAGWVVVRLDRSNDPIPAEKEGLREVAN